MDSTADRRLVSGQLPEKRRNSLAGRMKWQ
jgi:hypothetical protein